MRKPNGTNKEGLRRQEKYRDRQREDQRRRKEMPEWPDLYQQEYQGSFDNRQQFIEQYIAPMAMALYDDINDQYSNQSGDKGLYFDVAMNLGPAAVELICETLLRNDEFRLLQIPEYSNAVPAYILGPIGPTYKYYEMRYDCRPILAFLRRIVSRDVPYSRVVATFRRMATERIEERIKGQTAIQEYMPAKKMAASMEKAREIIKRRAAEMETRLEEELMKSIKGTVTQNPKRNEITINVEIDPLAEEKVLSFIKNAGQMRKAFTVGNSREAVRGIVIDEYVSLPKKRDKSVKVTTPKKRAIDL